jgi:hypothetical protein
MLSAFSRYILFASSYSPLTLAFGILYLRSSRPIAIALIGLAALSVALLAAILGIVRKMAREPLTSERSARKDSDTLSYLATYLIPFALSPPKDAYEGGALAIFVVVLAYLYVNSNMIYINPVLSAFGYHLYEVTPKNSKRTVIVLSRMADDLPDDMRVVEISRRIYIAPDVPDA